MLWNGVLDDAFGPACRKLQRLGYGARLPYFTGAPAASHPRNCAETDEWATHVVYADDLQLVAKRAFEA